MNAVNLPIAQIVCNEGQVPGLPRNPRYIEEKRLEELKDSLTRHSEMLDLRPLIVYHTKTSMWLLAEICAYSVQRN